MNVSNSNSNNDKRSKKPKPLFGLFRKNKPDPVVVPTPLGSGISSVPLHSVLSGQDPYAPPTAPLVRPPKPSVSDPRMPLSPQFQHYQQQQQRQQQQQQQMRRPRSKSTGGNTAKSFHHHQARSTEEARLLTERENALNKLCSNEITSPTSSLKASLPLLSPTYHNTPPPPIPPIPHYHKKQPQSPISPITPPPSSGGGGGIRKFSSAHDLRKAAKLQQESIVHVTDKIPLPKLNKDQYQLSRSRSLNSSSPRRIPVTTKASLPKKTLPINNNNDDDDSDDDIPLGYLQSPISKPSSLLSDEGEEDDKDLIPIAAAITTNTEYQSAADKYKEKVKERLQLDDDDDDDDDDIPISLAMLSPKERTKWHQNQIRG